MEYEFFIKKKNHLIVPEIIFNNEIFCSKYLLIVLIFTRYNSFSRFFFFAIKLIYKLQEIILQEISYRANILILRSFEKN